jgi:acyl-CoA thioesterase
VSAIGFLGVVPTEDPSRWQMHLQSRVLTHSGAVQGGAAFGAALEAMQAAVERPLVWASAQFVRHAGPAGTLDLSVEVELPGRNTTQARVSVRMGDTEVLTVWGALGARSFSGGSVRPAMPDVASPGEGVPLALPPGGGDGLTDHLEVRRAPDAGTGRWLAWCRRDGGSEAVSVGDLAVIGDLSMLAFSDALGRPVTGNSLDNSLRVLDGDAAGWVLLDVAVDAVHAGFGHAHARLWSEGGALLALAAQTLVMRDADGDGRSVRGQRQIVGGSL